MRILSILFSLPLIVLHKTNGATSAPKKDLYLMGLLPFGGSWPGGELVLAAYNMALEEVNRKDILPGYQLKLHYEKSECDIGTSINSMYRLFYKKPTKIMLVGPICSHACEVTAQAGKFWNITQISPGCGTGTLSDKSLYPYFMRVNGPDQLANTARIAFLKKHGWARIATVYETTTLFSLVVKDLQKRCTEENITTVRSETVTTDVKYQVENLKKYGARIIFIFTYQELGTKILCEALKTGIVGARYVYIFPAWWDDNWWTIDKETEARINCTRQELAKAASDTFGVANLFDNPFTNITGIANITAQEFDRLYTETSNFTKVDFGYLLVPSAYDTIWTIALGLNKAQERMEREGWNRTLEDFTYSDLNMTELILAETKSVDFMGVRGKVAFTPEGDCYTLGQITQVQEKTFANGTAFLKSVRLMIYKDATGNESEELITRGKPIWKGGKPPKDSMTTLFEHIHTSVSIYAVMTSIAVIGISLACFFLLFNLYHRKKRIIKMSSPNMNNCILVGCIVMYTTVIFTDFGATAAEGERQNLSIAVCKLPAFLACCGFSLSFGALFSKTYRVHRIFINKKMKRRIVKDIHLFAMVMSYLGINLLVLIVWEAVSPQTLNVKITSTKVVDADTETSYWVYVCQSPYSSHFSSVIYGIQGILLLFGAFLSWETRKVKIPELNDSKQIGMCVYNVIILSLLAVGMSFALENKVDLIYIVRASCILLGTTVTQIIIFVPKVQMLISGAVAPEDLSEGTIGTVTATISASATGDSS
ncbi:gamma-aminobutyric acid type B receptor subunit 1-like [Lineus longissimus]|uniref:gamma-aminobutyric acid type B receptor subunit 1-like n=1 Tax=Lineus longissimus TaxID=88925 RepID=UPI00315C6037